MTDEQEPRENTGEQEALSEDEIQWAQELTAEQSYPSMPSELRARAELIIRGRFLDMVDVISGSERRNRFDVPHIDVVQSRGNATILIPASAGFPQGVSVTRPIKGFPKYYASQMDTVFRKASEPEMTTAEKNGFVLWQDWLKNTFEYGTPKERADSIGWVIKQLGDISIGFSQGATDRDITRELDRKRDELIIKGLLLPFTQQRVPEELGYRIVPYLKSRERMKIATQIPFIDSSGTEAVAIGRYSVDRQRSRDSEGKRILATAVKILE